jgi:hypothetical protein
MNSISPVGYYAELADCSCPNCDFFDAPMLAIVNYPTLEEVVPTGTDRAFENGFKQSIVFSMSLRRKNYEHQNSFLRSAQKVSRWFGILKQVKPVR